MIFTHDGTRYRIHFEHGQQEKGKGRRKRIQRFTKALLSQDDPLTKGWKEIAGSQVFCSLDDRFLKVMGRFLAFHQLIVEVQKHSDIFKQSFWKTMVNGFYKECNLPSDYRSVLRAYFPSLERQLHPEKRNRRLLSQRGGVTVMVEDIQEAEFV